MSKKAQAIPTPDFINEVKIAFESGDFETYDIKSIFNHFCWMAGSDNGAFLELQQLVATLLERAMKNHKKFDDAFGLKEKKRNGTPTKWTTPLKAMLVVEFERTMDGNGCNHAARILANRAPWKIVFFEHKDTPGLLKRQRNKFIKEAEADSVLNATIKNYRTIIDLLKQESRLSRWEEELKSAVSSFGKKL